MKITKLQNAILVTLQSADRPLLARELADMIGTTSRGIATSMRALVETYHVGVTVKDDLHWYTYNTDAEMHRAKLYALKQAAHTYANNDIPVNKARYLKAATPELIMELVDRSLLLMQVTEKIRLAEYR